jgi:FkbM family methyltransferase
MRRRLTRKAVAALSRRLERPELLATLYPGARQELHEQIAIRAILASTLASDSTYVDVGTNRGQMLGEAVRIAPRGRHLAFEPIPELAGELGRAFPGVECRPLALGARAGEAEFCHFRNLDGWSGLRRNPEIDDERGRPEYISVTVSTLDAELEALSPKVVKIDVEGAELEVLEGARAVLARARPIIIFEHVAAAASLYDTPPGAPWDLLAEAGYDVFSVTGDGPYTRAAFAESRSVINWLATPATSNAGPAEPPHPL